MAGLKDSEVQTLNYLNEADLVAAASKGDKEAFAGLVELYWTTINIYLLRLCGEAELAADLTQETFFKAFKAIKQLANQQELNFKAWLHKIATNSALSYFRRKKNKAWFSLDQADGETGNLIADINLTDQSLSTENSREVVTVMKQLPKDQLIILLLRFYQELGYEEIAEILGIRQEAVRARVHRARLAFIRLYKQNVTGLE